MSENENPHPPSTPPSPLKKKKKSYPKDVPYISRNGSF